MTYQIESPIGVINWLKQKCKRLSILFYLIGHTLMAMVKAIVKQFLGSGGREKNTPSDFTFKDSCQW